MPIKTTLVVDDSKSARIMLSRMIQKQGLETQMVESGEEALAFMEANPAPDVIFLDHMMPGMNGTETCQILSSKYSTPIFMYTSKEGPEYEQEALNSGAAGILGKPAKPERLEQIISELNAAPEETTEISESTSTITTPADVGEIVASAEQTTTQEPASTPIQEDEMSRELIEEVANEVFGSQIKQILEPTTENIAALKSDVAENQSEIRKLSSRQANATTMVTQPVLDASIKQTSAQFQNQLTNEVKVLRELIERSTELSPSDLEQIKEIAIKSGAIAGSEEGGKAATSAAEAVAAKVSAAQAQIQVQQDIEPLLAKVKSASTLSTIALVAAIAAIAISFVL